MVDEAVYFVLRCRRCGVVMERSRSDRKWCTRACQTAALKAAKKAKGGEAKAEGASS